MKKNKSKNRKNINRQDKCYQVKWRMVKRGDTVEFREFGGVKVTLTPLVELLGRPSEAA